MWSTRVGAEVMKPLATPVLGGMVSSLLHVLVVTPVIFFWLQERRLGLQHEPLPSATRTPAVSRRPIVAVAAVLLLAIGCRWWCGGRRDGRMPPPTCRAARLCKRSAAAICRSRLLSPTGTLHQGRNTFTIEFRSARRPLRGRRCGACEREHADAGHGDVGRPAGAAARSAGRYEATAEFGMAGAWHMAIEWDGPAGHGSVNFEGAVQ